MNRRLTRGLGEVKQQGKWLACWLNDGRERSGDKTRTLAIIDRLQKLQSLLEPGTPVWRLANVKEVKGLEQELAEVTRHYLSWPRYAVESDSSGIGVAHIWLRGSPEESHAKIVIEKLLDANLLDRLALCAECKRRWVFRIKSDSKYCTRQCRQARYEATDERKTQKKKHNREYYQRWLRRDRKRRGKHGKK